MKRKKLHVMTIKDEAALSREEMKHIMAGSGGGSCEETNAVFCQCSKDDPWISRCATYDGTLPYNKCAEVLCGPQLVFNASWGIDWFCGNCP